MTEKTIRVLMIEDNPAEVGLMQEMLTESLGASFELVHAAKRLSTGLEWLTTDKIDVVLLDLLLPDSRGLETFDAVYNHAPHTPIIVLSGIENESLALEAVRRGAQDYLVKGQVDSKLLSRAVQYAIERKQAAEKLKRRAAELALLNDIGGRITSVLDLEDVLARAATMMHEKFGYHNVAILTVNHEAGKLEVRAVAGAFSDLFLSAHQVALGKGMVGWVGAHGKTLVTNDVREEPHYINPYSDVVKTRSELSVPIQIGEEVAGVLDVQSLEYDAFDDDDVMIAETLADQIAVAIENAQLYEAAQRELTERKQAERETRRYAEEQAALYAITSTVATSLDPNELTSNVLDVILPVVEADVGWVMLPGSSLESPPQIIASSRDFSPSMSEEITVPLASCPLYQSSQNGNSFPEDEELIFNCHCISKETLSSTGMKKTICVPLKTAQSLLGVLSLAWEAPPAQIEQALLAAIGRQVGLALRNAQLYQSARQVDRLQVLSDLDQALATTLDPDEVVEITLQQIAAALEVPVGVLFKIPRKGDADLTRAFVLERGWVRMSLNDQDEQRLQSLIQQLRDTRGTTTISDQDLLEICPEGHEEVAKYWGPHGLLAAIRGEKDIVAILALGGQPASRPFTEEDRALVQTAVSRAGQAMQNAWLYQASQDKSERLATLNAISNAAVSSLDLHKILHRVLEMTCQALGADQGSILMREEDSQGLRFAITSTQGADSLVGKRLEAGQGIAWWVLDTGQGACVNEVKDDPRWYDGIDQIDESFETHSLLCAPLEHQGEITGVIEIVNKCRGEFNHEDLNLLESVASIAATAIKNARLYADTQARAEELALLNELGLTLTSTLNYDEVVQGATSNLQQLFQADGVVLFQTDYETAELYLAQGLIQGKPITPSLSLLPDESIVDWVLENRETVLIKDAQADPRFPDDINQLLGIKARALMTVPLLTSEGICGLIMVLSEKKGVFDHNDLHILQALGSTLTVALENAHLYDEQKKLLREREETQAQLIHAEKMSALGRLAASIAHEINNPLQAVQGCLTLADEEVQDEKRTVKLERYLDIAGSEIERVSGIVRRMRDFYRPSKKEFRLINVHDVLDSVLALSNKQLQHADVTVEREWFEDLPYIEANADHLKQVFLNMVINAIDAMPGGGTLRVATTLTQIKEQNERWPAVQIEFEDTGVGMSPDIQERLFEPFFTTKEKGSGLGLSISYGIIQSHHGDILVTSEEAKGTTLTVLLPIEQPE